MRRRLLAGFVISLLMVVSAAQAQDDAPLAGDWESSCTPIGENAFLHLDFTFIHADWYLTYTVYGDSACATPLFDVSTVGPVEVGGASATVPDAREGIFTYTTRRATVYADALLPALDEAKCGAGDWQAGVAQNIDGGCEPISVKPLAECPVEYDLVSMAGDTLTLGDRSVPLCSPETRPTRLSQTSMARQTGDLDGEWISACVPAGGGNYLIYDFNFAGKSWGLTYTIYGDPACTSPVFDVSVFGAYTAGEPSPVVADATEHNFGFTFKRATVYVAALLPGLNDAKCGTGDWQVGEQQDVSDGCAPIGVGAIADCPVEYDLVSVTGDRIQLGDRSSSLCSPERRTAKLSGVPSMLLGAE